ncbi:tRNA1(Val) (adenine(37)-N6)-methyltransferase [Vibrio agarivorans]|uniref:tRNA1(Val) (adenine(37)-N6)-methyltransferase n=1 Tax=Vibrio agarivorans TaxID=153622 RepID=UPI002231F397|nr:methyltransferase [Vibrio agarivorans]MDN3662580.1 methyltransferase [Vibrio agarivorans]
MTQHKTNKTKSFRFKQFSIDGGYAGMAVSTDGVLLGAWSDCHAQSNILDIGTGTGLLSLMCAQRYSNTRITAIDIDHQAFVAASNNVRASPWSDRIEVKHLSLGKFYYAYPSSQFATIICNPPYFNSGETAGSEQRATARHTHTLSHEDLARHISILMTTEGRASLILPLVEGKQFIELAQQFQLTPTRLCRVKSTKSKPASRLLIELQHEKNSSSHQCIDSELVIMDNGQYSDAFVELTREFYLKM